MIDVVASIDSNLHNPCFLAALMTICVQVLVNLQKGILYGIFRQCLVTKVEITWIMKIAINTCYNINHSGWFRFFNHGVTPEMMPDEAVQTDESDEELTIAITKLPIKLREVILLHYYQGLKVNEIADALGISQSSVSGRLKRGRERLKKLLEGRELDE